MKVQNVFKIRFKLNRIFKSAEKSKNESILDFIKMLSEKYVAGVTYIGSDYYENERHERFIIPKTGFISISFNRYVIEGYFDSEANAVKFQKMLENLLPDYRRVKD